MDHNHSPSIHSTEYTVELFISEPSFHELDTPPSNSCALPDDEAVRNDIVVAVEDILGPRVEQNLAAFRCANDMSFDLINEWIDLVGDESGLPHISAGASIIAGQVADVLESEAAGAASTAAEIVQAIAEVVAENILNPAGLIDQLNASDDLMNESMPSSLCGSGSPRGSASLPNYDNLEMEQMPIDMIRMEQSSSSSSATSSNRAPPPNFDMSDLMSESMPGCPMAEVSIPHHDNLDNEQMPIDMLMLDQSVNASRGGSNRDMSNPMANESNQSQSQLQLQLTQLENLLSRERMQGECAAAAASIVVNQSKTIGTLAKNSSGQLVPKTVCGTITTMTTAIEPNNSQQQQQQPQQRPFTAINLQTSPLRNRPQASSEMLEDECAPEVLHDFSCELRGNGMSDIIPQHELEEFRQQLRENMNEIMKENNRRRSQSQSQNQSQGVTCPQRAEMMARVANMSVRLPELGNPDDLFNESAVLCDDPEEMPAHMRHIAGNELFQDVPSDEKVIRVTNAFISDRISGTNKSQMLIDTRNVYDRRLLLVIETRLNEAIRGSRGLFGVQFGSPCFPVRRLIDYVRDAVVDEMRSQRFEQLQNQRCAAGQAPLEQFGPEVQPLFAEPIGPRNWTQEDLYGPWPENMAVHVYEEEMPPQMFGPWPENRSVHVYEQEQERSPASGIQRRQSMMRAPGTCQGPSKRAAAAGQPQPQMRQPVGGGGARVPLMRKQNAQMAKPRPVVDSSKKPTWIGRSAQGGGGLMPKQQAALRVPTTTTGRPMPPTPPRGAGVASARPPAAACVRRPSPGGGQARLTPAAGPARPTSPAASCGRPSTTAAACARQTPSTGTTRATPATTGLKPPSAGGLRPPSAGGLRVPSPTGKSRASTGSMCCTGSGIPKAPLTRRSTPANMGGGGGGACVNTNTGLQQQASRMQASRIQATPGQSKIGMCARPMDAKKSVIPRRG